MEINLENLKAKLGDTGQDHVLAFWDELEDDEKEILANQIENMDFTQIKNLYENSKKDKVFNIEDISPIPYVNSLKMTDEEKVQYINIGEDAIKQGNVAVVSMAGRTAVQDLVIKDQKPHLN